MAQSGGYDLVELRQRMAACFSAAELRALAHELGVPATDRSSPQDQAGDLVRHFERAHRVETLIDELRRRQPLVVWPDRARVPRTVVDEPEDLAIGDLSSLRPGQLADLEEVDVDDEATSIQEPPVPSRRDRPISWTPPPPPSSQMAGPWPGAASREEGESQGRKGVDPRILVVVSGLTLATAVVAFVAGLRWSGDDAAVDPAAASSAQAAAGPAASVGARGKGVAGLAARALERGLQTVARKCEIADREVASVAVFASAHQQCGPSVARTNARRGPPRAAPEGPNGAEVPPAPPPEDAPQAIPLTDTPTLANPGSGCLTLCSEEHEACGTGCGPEPTKGSQYEAYQACQSKCLGAYSKCRLRCQ